MVFINPEVGAQMFRHTSSANWIGPVQAVFFGRECVPIIVDDVKFFLEFTAPPSSIEAGTFEGMLFKRNDGTTFYPRLEHRIVNLWFDDTVSEERMKPLCELNWHGLHMNHQQFVATLRDALLSYHETYPHIGQYFFQATEEIGRFFMSQVLEYGNVQIDGHTISLLSDIAPPYYGFVFNLKKES